ncbi:hypothetical protein ACQP04_12220 [Pseudonocardia halophobica]
MSPPPGRNATRAIATALGKVDEGEKLITDTQNRIVEARTAPRR